MRSIFSNVTRSVERYAIIRGLGGSDRGLSERKTGSVSQLRMSLNVSS